LVGRGEILPEAEEQPSRAPDKMSIRIDVGQKNNSGRSLCIKAAPAFFGYLYFFVFTVIFDRRRSPMV